MARVIRSGNPFVCNNTVDLEATAAFNELMMRSGFLSIVALPLTVDGTAVGVLLLAAHDADVVSDEELRMLRDVAGSLSFALQYLQQDTKVKFLAHFDPQTGLAKRNLFCERISRVLTHPASRRSRHAVVVFDIERLSLINDSFGRRTGDLLLQHVADRLHYSPEKHSEMMSRLALEHKLRVALEKRQFELHYQPKVNVATRRIEGAEALIRWRDPDGGLISPAAFLPVLESTGMIVDVGAWVIEQESRGGSRYRDHRRRADGRFRFRGEEAAAAANGRSPHRDR